MLIEQRKSALISKGEEFENYKIVGGMFMEPIKNEKENALVLNV